MRKREVAARVRRERLGASMSGDDVIVALAALDLENDPHKAARMFNINVRSIWRWKIHGAPPHIALAFDELLAGRLRPRQVRYFLARIGRSRDDGERYAPKSTSSSD